jgi:hypothetical protein
MYDVVAEPLGLECWNASQRNHREIPGLAFEIDRPEDRTVEVIYKLSTQRFCEWSSASFTLSSAWNLEERGGSASGHQETKLET